MASIQDGTGKGYLGKVNRRNQFAMYGVTSDETRDAVKDGRAYNINTGLISLTGTSESGILYFKNNEPPSNGESAITVTTVLIGVGTRSATVTDNPFATIIRNPTAGTLISNAVAVDMSSNSNFGSSNALDSSTLAYKGADGDSITGGMDHALIELTEGRNSVPIDIVLERGSSMAIKIDLNTSGGAVVYAAIVLHRLDASLVD